MSFQNAKPDFIPFIIICFLLHILACGGGGSDSGPESKAVQSSSFLDVKITADPGNARVTISWSPAAGATSYNVYVAKSPGVTKANGIKASDRHSSYVARYLNGTGGEAFANGTRYYFILTANTAEGESIASREFSAVPTSTPPALAPTNTAAQPYAAGVIRVNWTPSVPLDGLPIQNYRVYCSSTPDVEPIPANNVSGNLNIFSTSFDVVSLDIGRTYYFVVTASNPNGESVPSFEVSAAPQVSPPPTSPAGVTAEDGNGLAIIRWDPVAGATSYNVYYAADTGVSRTAGTKKTGVSSPLTVSPLTNKTGYFFVVTAVNANGESAESAMVSATPMEIRPHNKDNMVLIPAITGLQMGDNLDGTAHSLPVRTIDLGAFQIEPYDVIYDEPDVGWKAVYEWAVSDDRGAAKYDFDNAGGNGSLNIGTNMPVTKISWYDAVKWLNARSEKEGLTPVYYTDSSQTAVYRTGKIDVNNSSVKWGANGYRLLTEAEWEAAARGVLVGKRYPWGDGDSGKNPEPENANFNMGRAVSVGSYPPNGYGLYDTAGNVFKWVWDWGSESGYADYASAPYGPDTGSTRVRRGGSYSYGPQYLRCYERMFRVPGYAAPYFGFRVSRNAP